MVKTKLKKIIGNNAHWTLNKELVKYLGLTETLVLQHIIDLSESAFKRDEIWQPFPQMAEELGISEYSIKQAVGKLKSAELLNVKRKSVGYMNFYSVNTDLVLEIISGSNNSLVRGLSTHQPVDGVGELKNDSPVRGLSSVSESKNHGQTVENYSAITNNTTNNTEQKIHTNNTETSTGTDLYYDEDQEYIEYVSKVENWNRKHPISKAKQEELINIHNELDSLL